MSNSNWFWGTSKKSIACSGWVVTLFGGILIGGGIALILIPRWILEGVMAQNPTIGINAENYALVNLAGAFGIMIGVLSCILGIYVINRSLSRAISQPLPPPTH
jgi:ABC-type transport system involved in multi-copper enzyme maturation permease subunit